MARYSVWVLLIVSIPACAQDSGNAAAGALKGKMESLNFLKMLGRTRWLPAAGPKVCSIPLLNVKPNASTERMPVMRPAPGWMSREREVQVTAPACR